MLGLSPRGDVRARTPSQSLGRRFPGFPSAPPHTLLRRRANSGRVEQAGQANRRAPRWAGYQGCRRPPGPGWLQSAL